MADPTVKKYQISFNVNIDSATDPLDALTKAFSTDLKASKYVTIQELA